MHAKIVITAAIATLLFAVGHVFSAPVAAGDASCVAMAAGDTVVLPVTPLPDTWGTTPVSPADTTGVHTADGGVKNHRGLVRLVRRMLFVDPDRRSRHSSQVVDMVKELERYDGKVINSISYDRHDVFEDKSTWFRSLANGMHMRTVESALQRDMLLRTGEAFDPETAVTTNQIIQERPYISDSWLDVKVNPDDTTRVDITLVTFDNWTIGVGAAGRSESRAMFALYDYNFLGLGNRVGAETYFRYKNPKYYGNVFDYGNPNLFGTFYTAAIRLGHDWENTYTDFEVGKEFILPTDYEAGASYHDDKFSRFNILGADTVDYYNVSTRAFDAWGGWSHALRSKERGSVFATVHYLSHRFPTRPDDTGPRMHPRLHDRDEVLFGTGVYWERFYLSSMIYGYGFQEYIASGQKFQLVGGYSWQEFGDYWYAGFTSAKGGFTRLGYLRGEVSAGSYINSETGRLWQSAVNIQTAWFSNLLDVGRGRIRFFINARYTRGWNRGEGAGSLVRFSRQIRPTSFDTYAAGSNRLLVNTETVLFTHLRPLGFRIALFGFADAGWIGSEANTFRNDFFSSFGIGVRFRNERLVFSALQLRFGLAVGRNGLVHNDIVGFSSEQRMNPYRFIPTRPETVAFK